ncbi:MAG: efflux RND transporter permease subunit [Alphaproteobacteria bacterium]|nr:efflux RND transporter permease subunit [Alphaproteobacteria bacterium]
MQAIIYAALDRSRTVLAALVMILVAGTIAYQQIPKESQPDIDIPIIYVSVTLEGISPEDGERLLVRPLETKLKTVEGLKEMRATTVEGQASIILEFEAGFDADKALRDVRDKVDQGKKDLPGDAEEPVVQSVNVGLFPVLIVTLSGNLPERTLTRLARDLKDRLEGLPGVLEAQLVGKREELLEVVVDPKKLENYRVSQTELINAVTLNNRLVAAGAIDTGQGRFSVKVPGLFETARDVLDLPIKVSAEGVVTLGDITTIRSTFKDPTSFARLNGQPAIALEIKKRIGENVILTIEDVQRTVELEKARWPEGVEVTYTQDASKDIRDMLSDLGNNLLSAIVMVMIVVVASLGLRSGALVGIAIPASFLMGILVLAGMGLTVNIVVLFSLILAAGNVVDGAIVVTEYAERRMTEGIPKREAYAMAASRMSWPIIASIATQACAFMPLLFWPGVVGEFMKYLPLTQVITLTASLIVALIFVTVLGSYFGKPAAADAASAREVEVAERGDLRELGGFLGSYARVLSLLVRHPAKVTIATILILVGVQGYYATHGNGVEFFPDVDPPQALIYVHARGNLSIQEKDALVREVEQRVIGHRGIRTVYTRTGGRTQGSEETEDTIGVIRMEFEDWKSRPPAKEILRQLREKTADLAGISVETRIPEAGPPTGKAVQIQLASHFPDLLPEAVARVRARFDATEGLIDVEDTRPQPGIEWQVKVDRAQAGRFGTDVASVGAVVQLVTTGIKVGEYRPDGVDEEVDIRVRFPVDERGISQIDNLRVETPKGLVPISNFITRTPQQKVGSINRFDGRRVMLVRANVEDGVLPDDKVRELRQWLQSEAGLDPRIDWRFRGKDEEQQKAADFLGKAFLLAMFLMAIVLVTQFNSFYHAFLILTSVVLSTIGVVLGLIVTGQTFGIVMTGIGIIALAGIVVNNNIVLIDAYAELRQRGLPPIEAAVRTGVQRLRPVFLTAIVSVLGLLPMVFRVNVDFFGQEISIGAPATQWWVQISTAIAFGLGFATVLTLVITPSLLVLGENFGFGVRRLSRRILRRQPKPQPAE